MNNAARTGRYFAAMRYQHPALLAGCVVLLLSACRKDKEGTPPAVSISAPAAGSTVNIPDTIAVTVTASDDERVERITVTIVDADGVPVTTGAGSSPLSNPATAVIALPVISERIESGTYTLVATATDGETTSRDSRPITLIAAPFRLRAVFAVTTPGPQTVALYRIDSLAQVGLAATYPMDLGGAAVSSEAQLLYLAGRVTGPLQALSPNDLGVRWQKPNLGTLGAPYFTAITLGPDERLYAGVGDGHLHGYVAGSGTGAIAADLESGFRTERTVVVGDQIVSAEQHQATQQRHLAIYLQASGSPQGTQVLDLAPIGLFARDADHLLLFGNRDGHGVVEDRYLPLGGGWEPYAWPAEITAVTRLGDTDAFIVAFADGGLARFTYTDAGSIALASGPVVHDLAFNAADTSILAASDGEVRALAPTTGMVLATFPMGGDVRHVLPLYNREPQ